MSAASDLLKISSGAVRLAVRFVSQRQPINPRSHLFLRVVPGHKQPATSHQPIALGVNGRLVAAIALEADPRCVQVYASENLSLNPNQIESTLPRPER